jgi:hypothetical protein
MNRLLLASALFVRMALMAQEQMGEGKQGTLVKTFKLISDSLDKANFRAGQSGHVP